MTGFDLDFDITRLNAGISVALRKICLLFTSIYSHDFLTCKLQKANLFLLIANMNHCLSLGLTKTDYEMRFNHEGHSTEFLIIRNLK